MTRVINEQRYADALRRTRERIRDGQEIQTPGTIFHWAHEQGWTGLAHAALRPSRTAIAIELAIVKAKAADAYKLGRLKSRDQARVLLARFCQTVADADIRRELAKTVAACWRRTAGPSANSRRRDFPRTRAAGAALARPMGHPKTIRTKGVRA